MPEAFLKCIIELSTKENDIVLDLFIGTGTTCAVAHIMGRQYIGVEQLDNGENSGVVRLKNVIDEDKKGISQNIDWKGGSYFVYMELMKLNKAFVEKISDARTIKGFLEIWENMKHNGFLSYRYDPILFDENMEEFKTISLDEQKKLLLGMLNYNDLYVNYSEIDDTIYNVSEEDKNLTKNFTRGRKMQENQRLSQEYDVFLKMEYLMKDIPKYIKDNLNPRFKLRPYQIKAIARFIHYLEENPN